jgi:hypothetical protein
MGRWPVILGIGFLTAICGFGQGSANRAIIPGTVTPFTGPLPPNVTVTEKWHTFVQETVAPITLAAGAFNAAVSQATNSDPRYGVGAGAYAQRFGASTADIVTQNFFSDFMMASVFHQDSRYVRRGSAYGGIWKRAGYAVSRAFITHADAGGDTFNWSNLTGTAMSAAASNVYYPAASRNASAAAMHFGTSLIGVGLFNLYPEFWPDFYRMLARHHLIPGKH